MSVQSPGCICDQTRLMTSLAVLLAGFLLVATAGPPGATSTPTVTATPPAAVTMNGKTFSSGVSRGESNVPRYRF